MQVLHDKNYNFTREYHAKGLKSVVLHPMNNSEQSLTAMLLRLLTLQVCNNISNKVNKNKILPQADYVRPRCRLQKDAVGRQPPTLRLLSSSALFMHTCIHGKV